MNPRDYDYLRKLFRERSGLVLSSEKQYLVESRLLPLARKHAMSSLAELVATLKTVPSSPLAAAVVEAMTTNESFFFRDKVPFEHFRNVILPSLLQARSREKRIRIWCNAASNGQEPYSLAMILNGLASSASSGLAGWKIDILATDISLQVLEKAKAGIYSQFEVQRGLPIQLLVKYFSQVGETWQIAPHIRAMVNYKPFNLLTDFAVLGQFDVVFCRNVLIYFDRETKTEVLNRLSRTIAADGYLVLGAAETVVGLTDLFKPMRDHRGVYVRNTAAPERSPPSTVASPSLAPAAPHISRVVAGAKH